MSILVRVSVIACIACMHCSASLFGDDALVERFRAEAPDAWRKWVQEGSCVAGKVAHRRINTSTNAVFTELLHEVSACGDEASLTIQWTEGVNAGKTFAFGRNGDYSFGMESPQGGNWAIKSIGDMSTDAVPDGSAVPPTVAAAQLLWRPLLLTGEWLHEAIEHQSVHVAAASAVSNDGHELVQIDFTVPSPKRRADGMLVKSGIVVTDPEQHWLPLRGTLQVDWLDGKEVGTVEVTARYSNVPGSVPLIESFEERRSSRVAVSVPDADIPVLAESRVPMSREEEVVLFTWDYDLKLLVDPNPARFRLSSFGLPEPEAGGLSEQKKSAVGRNVGLKWVLFGTTGALSIALVVLILRDRKRSQKQ